MVALLGVFRLVNMMMAAMIWPATENSIPAYGWVVGLYTAAASEQPVPDQLSRVVLWRIWDLILGLALVWVGVRMSGGAASPANLVSFIVLVGSGCW